MRRHQTAAEDEEASQVPVQTDFRGHLPPKKAQANGKEQAEACGWQNAPAEDFLMLKQAQRNWAYIQAR